MTGLKINVLIRMLQVICSKLLIGTSSLCRASSWRKKKKKELISTNTVV